MRSLIARFLNQSDSVLGAAMVLTNADMGDLLRQLGDTLTGRSNILVTVTVKGEGAEITVRWIEKPA